MRAAIEREDRRKLHHSYSLKSLGSAGTTGEYFSSVSTALSSKSDVTSSQVIGGLSFSYEEKFLHNLYKPRCHSSSELRASLRNSDFTLTTAAATQHSKPRSQSSNALPSARFSRRREHGFEFRKCMNCEKMYASSEKEAFDCERWDVRWKYCSGECHVTHISRTCQAKQKSLEVALDEV